MSGSTISSSETRIEALTIQSSAYGVTIPLVLGVARVPINLVDYLNFKAVPHTTSQGGKGGVRSANTTYTYEADVALGVCHGPISGVPTIWRGKQTFAGGLSAAQLETAVEIGTVPTAGPMTIALQYAATFAAITTVKSQWDIPDQDHVLANEDEYTVAGGALIILSETYRGSPLQITYQHIVGQVQQTALEQLGLSFKTGAIAQDPWGAFSSAGLHEIGYSGLAMLCGQGYDLGAGAQVENHSVEVIGPLAYHLGPTQPDIDPALAVRAVLTDGRYGADFPAERLDSWAEWSTACIANGLLVSPALTTQQTAAEIVAQAAKLTNTAPVWSAGRLRMVPLADTSATANGQTFTPNLTPVYHLTDESWLAAPVSRFKSPADRKNHIRLEYLDRANQYNPAIVEAKDQADIDTHGLRTADVMQAHWIKTAATARQAAQLLLQRSLYVTGEYTAILPAHFALLDPADLVLATDAGLTAPWRVTSIEEGEDGDLTVTFEDAPPATGSASRYTSQTPAGYQADYNAAPGPVDPPVIFEAPASRSTTGLEVYAAVRGGTPMWGGCQVWASSDGANYRLIGQIHGPSRYGALASTLAAGAATTSINGLAGAQLLSGSAADAAALNTLCYIGGASPEYVAYQSAVLTGPGQYTLGGLVRGASHTQSAEHLAGAPLVRIDDSLAKSGALGPEMLGKNLSFKFPSFNLWGGAQETLADAMPYTYQVTGVQQSNAAGQINVTEIESDPESTTNSTLLASVAYFPELSGTVVFSANISVRLKNHTNKGKRGRLSLQIAGQPFDSAECATVWSDPVMNDVRVDVSLTRAVSVSAGAVTTINLYASRMDGTEMQAQPGSIFVEQI